MLSGVRRGGHGKPLMTASPRKTGGFYSVRVRDRPAALTWPQRAVLQRPGHEPGHGTARDPRARGSYIIGVRSRGGYASAPGATGPGVAAPRAHPLSSSGSAGAAASLRGERTERTGSGRLRRRSLSFVACRPIGRLSSRTCVLSVLSRDLPAATRAGGWAHRARGRRRPGCRA
jgi:hypothetical protein